MNGAIIAQIILLSAVVVGGQALSWRKVRRLAERQRRTYEASYDSAIESRLTEYVELVRTTFGPALFAHAPVEAPLVAHANPVAFLRETVALIAARFSLEMPEIEARFVSDVPSGAPAVMQWDAPWEMRQEGNVLHIRSRSVDSPNWRVLIQELYRYDDELLTVFIAHEVAHVALLARGVRLPKRRDNEELTDTAAVLAGFGPLMRRASFYQSEEKVGRRRWRVSYRRFGYLHRRAIEILMDRRAKLAPA